MRISVLGWLLGLALAGTPATALCQPPAAAADRFEAELKKFDETDRTTPPPTDAVVFTGSSSIRLWKSLAEDFPQWQTLNRGFGGSEIDDAIRNVNRLVIRYRPRTVVFYSGDNDINSGKSPARVAADMKQFVGEVHRALPRTRIVIISIKPSLARWKLAPQMQEANALIKTMAEKDPLVTYVDVFTPMLGPDGKPRPELYVEDGLHMTPAGYAIWKREVGRKAK